MVTLLLLRLDARQRTPSAVDRCIVALVQADITTLTVDAIVNAANNHLQRGGGVCGSIFSAAGPSLDVACAAINGCATGQAVLTDPFGIRHVKAIVHAVGPRVSGPVTDEHRQQLASSYMRSLDAVVQHGLTSIVRQCSCLKASFILQAFPCISTAIYGFPNEAAAEVALNAVTQWLNSDNNIEKVEV